MRKPDWHHYDVHGVLAISSNKSILSPFFRTRKLRRRPDLVVLLGDLRADQLEPSSDNDALRVIYRPRGLLRSEVLLEGLASGGQTRLFIVNPAHRLLGRLSRKVRALIRTVFYIKLLQKWHALLHSACVEKDGAGLLMVAPPETGKTLTTLKLVLGHGFRFMSDDMTIVGPDATALANPGTLTIHPYHLRACGIKLRGRELLDMRVRHLLRGLPYVVFFVKEFKLSFRRLFSEDQLARRAKVAVTCFLEAGPRYIGELDADEALRRLMAAGRMHVSVYESGLIQRYAYQNPEFDLEGLMDRLRQLCRRLVESTSCWHVRCPDKRFSEFIVERVWPTI